MVFLVKSQFLSIVFQCFPMVLTTWQPLPAPYRPTPDPAAQPGTSFLRFACTRRRFSRASWKAAASMAAGIVTKAQAEKSETRAWETVAATGGEKTHNQGTKNVGKMETNWEIKGKMDY
jgi:hypothetical protein